MTIIVLDDEQLQLETMLEYLTELYPLAEVVGFGLASKVLEYVERHTVDVAILDISIPGSMNGITLGSLLREKNRNVRLLYCTGYAAYAMDAFKIHANGYLQKPICRDALREELAYILQMPVFGGGDKPFIHTFGNFDIFVGDKPVVFRRSKSKEVLAYLTDREGSWVTNRELTAVLWENMDTDRDETLGKYASTVIKDMTIDLENAGAGHIVERQRGRTRLVTGKVDCDYFLYLDQRPEAVGRFRGEYMNQYSWGEMTLASIVQRKR